ncbi:related to cysteine dioxygenase type I [Phialocephala subalpina]|uniref:Cysteine dioxygenase n=1 Tax=Phialocephala subalpina TaxID=576137 RepID=A0A1L7XDK9_9HELO|nr:related to cysteine dioxygenase type I [Phialocephala subalpina]
MAPIKSSSIRALRSNVSVRPSRVLSGVNRGITGTSKIASPWETTQSTSHITPALPPVFHRLDPIQRPTTKPETNKTPFDDLLNSITHSLGTTPKPFLPHLHNLLRSYTSNPDHWSKYAHQNPSKQYTRNLVCELPGIFNLLILVWTPRQASPIHDHADSHCLMKILKGQLQESRFAIPKSPGNEGPLVETARVRFGVDKVAYIADNLGLHEISNPHPTEYAVSLHLYTPPNAAMRGCHVFDAETGESRHVMQCAYDSVGGVVAK